MKWQKTTAFVVGLYSTTYCGDSSRAHEVRWRPFSNDGVVRAELQVLSFSMEEVRSTFGIMVGIWAKF